MTVTFCHNQSEKEAMSGEIEIEIGLTGYLGKDADVVETSGKEWEPEYNALSRLVGIFRRMSQLVVVKDKNLSLPSQLFLVVLNQSYGVASELLRRRTTDAQGLMRRAVEAAGVAHRLWKHPALTEVFNEAYPDINDDNHPKQFRPSNKYRQEFSSSQMFSGDSSALQTLGSLCELFSVGASHAGLGALTGQKRKDGILALPVRETNRVEIGRAWHNVNLAYWEILRVFFAILKSAIPDGMTEAVEADMKQWFEEYKRTLKDRTPWIPDIHKINL
jgi:YD repeat-containing protein